MKDEEFASRALTDGFVFLHLYGWIDPMHKIIEKIQHHLQEHFIAVFGICHHSLTVRDACCQKKGHQFIHYNSLK